MWQVGALTRGDGLPGQVLDYAVVAVGSGVVAGSAQQRLRRCCEVAVVRLRGDGLITDEWTTLVNPGTPLVGARGNEVHDRDVAEAPSFGEIAADLSAMLAGALVVCTDIDQALPLIDTELAEADVSLGCRSWPVLCLLQTTRIQLDLAHYSLPTLSDLLTSAEPQPYTCLGVARRAAAVLAALTE